MSVALFHAAELEAMHHELGDDMTLFPAVRALAWANRAAYGTTYGAEVNAEINEPLIRPPNARDPEELRRDIAKARRIYGTVESHVKGLLYNCISNDGYDFSDDFAAVAVLRAARIADGSETRLAVLQGGRDE